MAKTDFPFDYDLKNLLKIQFSGYFMYVTKRYKYHYIDNEYEKFSTELFLNYIEDDSIVIDVGANYGYYSLLASSKNKNGETYAIEPVKENFQILQKNAHENGFKQLKAFNCAVSNKSGKRKFNITEASDSAGFYEHPNAKTIKRRTIDIVSLDKLFQRKKVDVIKIDTEGHEFFVLEGMKNVIKKNSNIKIFFEFNPRCLKKSGIEPEKLLKRIKALGMDVYFIRESEKKLFRLSKNIDFWKEIISEEDYCNILCVRKEKSLMASFFSHSSERGGAELSLLELVKGLVKRKVLCHVVLPNKGYLYKEFQKIPISIDILPLPWWTYNMPIEKNGKYINIINSLKKLKELIEKVSPKIIYTNTSVLPQGGLIAKMVGVPHIWHIDEFGEKDHGLKFLLNARERSKFMYEYSDSVIFNSNVLKKYYEKYIPKNKSLVYYYNVQLPVLKNNKVSIFNKKSSLKLLLIGTIINGKGQFEALKALKYCIEKFGDKNLELAFVGRIGLKKYFDKIKNFIKENNLDGYISIHDFKDNPTSVYAQSDIVLMCSKSEAFGRVTVEAMKTGKPVIGRASSATRELIKDNYSGILYKPGSFKDLAKKIHFLNKNRNRLPELAANAKDSAQKRFSDMGYSGNIYNLLNRLKKSGKIPQQSNKNLYFGGITSIYNQLSDQLNLSASLRESNRQKDQAIFQKNKELEEKKEEIKEYAIIVQNRENQLNAMRNSLRWKIPNYFYKLIKFRILQFRPAQAKKFVEESLTILRREGVSVFAKGFFNYLLYGQDYFKKSQYSVDPIDYENWIIKNERLNKNNLVGEIDGLEYQPRITVIMSVHDADEILLRKAIFSVIYQYYQNWELIIVENASQKRIIRKMLSDFQDRDRRIKVISLDQEKILNKTLNEAAEKANGEFISFVDQEDELSPDALYENAKLLNKNSNLDLIYGDEDKIDKNSSRTDPNFKPDWSPELALFCSYVGQLKIMRKEIFLDARGYRKKLKSARDYDLLLRISEITDRIAHIPKILYHNRTNSAIVPSTNIQSREILGDLKNSLQEAIGRRSIKGKAFIPDYAVKTNAEICNISFKSSDYSEKVTIIIPTKDKVEILKRCIESIKRKTSYKNYKILVINNNSQEKKTFDYLKAKKINYLTVSTAKFNFSKINNTAVNKVGSELVLLLNNDTEVISPDWLLEMVGTMSLSNKIGAVGAKLIYNNNRVQHAGVILGLSEQTASHANKMIYCNDPGYQNYNLITRNYSAVTAACMLTKKSLYQKVGGMDEENLAVQFNDVDYCLKLLINGYRIVYSPDALLYHYERQSRKVLEYDMKEVEFFRKKWGKLIKNDPFYNPNLSLDNERFEIKKNW